MESKEELKEFSTRAWAALWTGDRSAISTFFTENAMTGGYTPPKQTYWHGLDAITAHFNEVKQIVVIKSFNITNLDLVKDSDAFYATWNAEFDMKIPGAEGVMPLGGIAHVIRKEGKISQWIMYEDPTPFVAMALKGQS